MGLLTKALIALLSLSVISSAEWSDFYPLSANTNLSTMEQAVTEYNVLQEWASGVVERCEMAGIDRPNWTHEINYTDGGTNYLDTVTNRLGYFTHNSLDVYAPLSLSVWQQLDSKLKDVIKVSVITNALDAGSLVTWFDDTGHTGFAPSNSYGGILDEIGIGFVTNRHQVNGFEFSQYGYIEWNRSKGNKKTMVLLSGSVYHTLDINFADEPDWSGVYKLQPYFTAGGPDPKYETLMGGQMHWSFYQNTNEIAIGRVSASHPRIGLWDLVSDTLLATNVSTSILSSDTWYKVSGDFLEGTVENGDLDITSLPYADHTNPFTDTNEAYVVYYQSNTNVPSPVFNMEVFGTFQYWTNTMSGVSWWYGESGHVVTNSPRIISVSTNPAYIDNACTFAVGATISGGAVTNMYAGDSYQVIRRAEKTYSYLGGVGEHSTLLEALTGIKNLGQGTADGRYLSFEDLDDRFVLLSKLSVFFRSPTVSAYSNWYGEGIDKTTWAAAKSAANSSYSHGSPYQFHAGNGGEFDSVQSLYSAYRFGTSNHYEILNLTDGYTPDIRVYIKATNTVPTFTTANVDTFTYDSFNLSLSLDEYTERFFEDEFGETNYLFDIYAVDDTSSTWTGDPTGGTFGRKARGATILGPMLITVDYTGEEVYK